MRTAAFVLFSIAALAVAGPISRPKDPLVHVLQPGCKDPLYNITFFHVNDVHSHLDEFSSSGTDCTRPERGCFGGYARIKAMLDDLRPKTKNSLLLNIGDEFQGTLFFTFYGGDVIAKTINQLGFDAMTLGNHEWDRGEDHLGAFLKNITFPIIASNVKSGHPALNSTIVPYKIFNKHSLAVVAAVTTSTPDISSVGNTTTFEDPITSLQTTINRIKRSHPNIKRFAAITHVGYDVDKVIAQKTKGLHLIIGGHSHTPLGEMANAEGKYPTIEKNLDGEDVLIVQAYRWGEYFGKIDVSYNLKGNIVAYSGGPIHLDNTTAQDPVLQAQIDEWRVPFDEFASEVVGEATTELGQATCKSGECVLGNVMADAIVEYRKNTVVGAMINGGGVRATIDVGPITRGEIVTAFPFGNAIVEQTYTGEVLWKSFEGIFSGASQFNDRPVISGVQISKEIQVTYNATGAIGSRLVSLSIGGAPVDFAKEYTIGLTDFHATGGDNQLPAVPPSELTTLDLMDEVLTRYIQAHSPISASIEGRIVAV